LEAKRGGVVLVTGGSRGIGRATCLLAARMGYAVAVNFLESGDKAAAVVKEITDGGGGAIAVKADVSNSEDVAALFETTRAALGPVSHLVNNAGAVGCKADGLGITEGRFTRALAVNLTGVFLCVREAAARMIAANIAGAIVNVSSYSVQTGGPGYHVDYAAAKAGVESLTRGFARELAPKGIRVNAVAPGTIATDMSAKLNGEKLKGVEKRIALGRLGRAEEVAEAIVWLMSPTASYVTGAIIPVSGGR
jgi:NAD(P)-dependent dehydrogenase (short-subunit alcohol dehydrogenase family)